MPTSTVPDTTCTAGKFETATVPAITLPDTLTLLLYTMLTTCPPPDNNGPIARQQKARPIGGAVSPTCGNKAPT